MTLTVSADSATSASIVLLADDLTGALDAAAPFAAQGLSAQVIPSFALGGERAADPEVLVLCTDTRDSDAARSAEWLGASIRRAVDGTATTVGIKIDSLLRGRVAADLRAVVSALTPSGPLIIAPAYPSQGRITRYGEVFVDGVALSATEYHQLNTPPTVRSVGSESGWPARSIGVTELRAEGFVSAFAQDMAGKPVAVVFDAETDDDLALVVAAGMAAVPAAWVGSAGLFEQLAVPLARSIASSGTVVHRPDEAAVSTPPRRVLVASGSASTAAKVQLDELAASGAEVKYVNSPGEVSRAVRSLRAALAVGEIAAIGAQKPDSAAHALERRHSFLVASVVAELAGSIDALVVVGGDTALQVFKQLGVDALQVTASPGNGMAAGFALSAGVALEGTIPFVSKAGSFGDDRVLIQAVDYVQSQFTVRDHARALSN